MTEKSSDEELQALWNDQPTNLTIIDMKELSMTLKTDYTQEQRRLFLLNLQEVIPAVGLFFWAAWKGLQANNNEWAWFVAALVSLAVGGFLVLTSLQQRRLEQTFETTIRGELERSRSQLQHRADLYRNVAWWYLLPVAVVIIMILIASDADFATPFTLGYLMIVAGGLVALYRWNRKIGREKYEPKAQRLSRLIADLG